ncbi:hypothetical protein C1Y63_01235 [Corynebacterium sp. 13CS0277]|uniref:hypothetical protein n=1 Tax=Corynebacterium sp. 13CS0277 TaxID=2071994 RepID=UPI000D0453D6|nr:hypothetical protein [Corynebacterium sp. 13CS0277]PRQ12444.1 hypothetical protein C1Y63_01235 [Corynebacterium sp. 13CS0277]
MDHIHPDLREVYPDECDFVDFVTRIDPMLGDLMAHVMGCVGNVSLAMLIGVFYTKQRRYPISEELVTRLFQRAFLDAWGRDQLDGQTRTLLRAMLSGAQA